MNGELNKFKIRLPFLEKVFVASKSVGYSQIGKVYVDDEEIGLYNIVTKTLKKGTESQFYAEILLTKTITEDFFVYYRGYHNDNNQFTFESLIFKEDGSVSTKQIKDLITYS